jgi:hypothetical protein
MVHNSLVASKTIKNIHLFHTSATMKVANYGPTYEKTSPALTAFLDVVVEVGLLCHPGKLTPPDQVVKYTGILFDTSTVPKIRVPEYKCAKALAMTDFAIRHRSLLSRLGLAVVAGVLF